MELNNYKFPPYENTEEGIKEGINIVALLTIVSVKSFKDILNNEEYYIIKYLNHKNNTRKEFKYIASSENISFKDKDLLKNPKKINDIIHSLIFSLIEDKKIKEELSVSKKGFYIYKSELIDNTDTKNINPSKKQLEEAFNTLNQIINYSKKDRNNLRAKKIAYIYKYMLVSPFFYCLKQLNKANNNIFNLIIYGYPNTTKTTSVQIGYWFYSNPFVNLISVDSVSSLQKEMEKNTFPLLLDENINLLDDNQIINLIKRGSFNTDLRTITDIEDYKKLENYSSLKTLIFTSNHMPKLKDGLQRRFKGIYFDSRDIITPLDSKEFDNNFYPLAYDSPMDYFLYIGAVFKNYLKNYLESDTDLLNNIMFLTSEILKDIGRDYNITIHPYLLEDNSKNVFSEDIFFNTDDLKDMIYKDLINNLEKDNIFKNPLDISLNLPKLYNFLEFQTQKDRYILNIPSFRKYCNSLINQSLDEEDLLKKFGLANNQPHKTAKIRNGIILDKADIENIFSFEF